MWAANKINYLMFGSLAGIRDISTAECRRNASCSCTETRPRVSTCHARVRNRGVVKFTNDSEYRRVRQIGFAGTYVPAGLFSLLVVEIVAGTGRFVPPLPPMGIRARGMRASNPATHYLSSKLVPAPRGTLDTHNLFAWPFLHTANV